MNYKRLVGAILVITILLCGTFLSCSPTPGPTPAGGVTPGGGVSEFEVIRQAADAYLSSGKAGKTISGKEVWALISDDNKKNDPRMLSVRDFSTDLIGHICGTITVPWRQLFTALTPERFDGYFSGLETDNQQIVVYSYTGQEGGGPSTAFLNMLGRDAINLQWGFSVWLLCPDKAPGVFMEETEGGTAIGQDYTTETTVNKPTQEYPFPVVENTDSEDKFEIIRAAAAAWAQSKEPLPEDYHGSKTAVGFLKFTDVDIKPKYLFSLLHDADPGNAPFVLSVQEPELYAKGHIPGAIWIPLTDVAKPENLHKLPPDRQIVVVSNDGISSSQVTGILNALGYHAVNLLFGMTGWTKDDDIAPGRFHIWEADKITYKDVLDLPFCFEDVAVLSGTQALPPGWQSPSYWEPPKEDF